jgi:hypothetical protein
MAARPSTIYDVGPVHPAGRSALEGGSSADFEPICRPIEEQRAD